MSSDNTKQNSCEVHSVDEDAQSDKLGSFTMDCDVQLDNAQTGWCNNEFDINNFGDVLDACDQNQMTDEDIARQLQLESDELYQYNLNNINSHNSNSVELIDPNPDIHSLFLYYNDLYFQSRLSGVEIKWSKRMTLYV